MEDVESKVEIETRDRSSFGSGLGTVNSNSD
jgi:hypothetical protein